MYILIYQPFNALKVVGPIKPVGQRRLRSPEG